MSSSNRRTIIMFLVLAAAWLGIAATMFAVVATRPHTNAPSTYEGPVGLCRVNTFLYEDSFTHCNLGGMIPRAKNDGILAALQLAHDQNLTVTATLDTCPYPNGVQLDCEVTSVTITGSVYEPPPILSTNEVAQPGRRDASRTCAVHIPADARQGHELNWTAYFEPRNLTHATAYFIMPTPAPSCAYFVVLHDGGSCRIRDDDTCEANT